MRIAPAEQRGLGRAVILRVLAHLAAACSPAHPNSSRQLRVPCAAADVEQQGARRVGRVGRVHRAAGQPPQQERCRPCRTPAGPAAAAARAPSTWSSSQAILVAEKYGSSSSPVFAAIAASWPSRAQPRAGVRGAPVLPDDGVVDRLAGGAVPHDRGLALVGDADAGDVLGRDAGLGHRGAHGRDHRRPDLLRIVLDLARRRIDLAQLLLRAGDRRERCVEHDGARRGGALVDGDEVGHGLRWFSSNSHSLTIPDPQKFWTFGVLQVTNLL